MQDERISDSYRESAFVYQNPVLPSARTVIPGASGSFHTKLSYDPGAVGVGSVGYGLGNGFRAELEGDYRYNPVSNSEGSRYEQKMGVFGNVLYDFNIGTPIVTPYAGIGVGYMWADRGYTDGRTNSFAYQAIVGVATPLPFVPGLSATLEYRFLGQEGARTTQSSPATTFSGEYDSTTKYTDGYNHSVLIGLRYAFNSPKVAPPPASPQPVPTLNAPARTYLVFFDWDRSDLTDRARQIVADAAQASTRVEHTSIEVQGNADKSGTPEYNQRLSLRRAQTVAAELVRDGVPSGSIAIQAFGDTRPLVQTAAGVREPQNRRVEIILR